MNYEQESEGLLKQQFIVSVDRISVFLSKKQTKPQLVPPQRTVDGVCSTKLKYLVIFYAVYAHPVILLYRGIQLKPLAITLFYHFDLVAKYAG